MEVDRDLEHRSVESPDEADHLADRDALVHELGVRQEELEAQNEELRRAHQLLEVSRRRYLDLYDLAPAGYLTFSRDGMVVATNLTGAALLGSEREAMVGRPFYRFLPQESTGPFYRHLRTVIDERASASVELALLRSDGASFWAHLDSAPVPPYEGSNRCWCVITDVSDRRKAQDALRESEDRYRSIVEQSEDGITLIDERGGVLEWNRAQERIFGLSRKAALGMPFWAVMAGTVPQSERTEATEEEFKAVIMDLLSRGAASPAAQPMEREIGRPDGTRRVVQVLPFAIPGNDGYRAGAISRDITEMRQAIRIAAEERERLATTLRSIGEGVLTTDDQGQIVLMNAVAEEVTGWQEAEAAGRPARDVLNLRDERTGKPMGDPVAHALTEGKPVSIAGYAVLTPAQGSSRPVMVSAAPIRNGGGGTAGVVVVFRDVTESRRLEQVMTSASKLEAVGLLAGGIAHDFNNLLTAIIGNIALSRMEAAEGTEIFDMLGEAEKAAIRAKDLTQQLLTFARGGAPVRRAASLAEVLQDSCGFALRGSKSSCVFSLSPDLWSAEIDIGQISQVIQNLVINADEAMPMGGTITVSAENAQVSEGDDLALAPGRYVKLAVGDRGVGIRREYLTRIFDPYFTTKQKGSGLGLATSYSIVHRHDGQIRVESEPGRGSVFTVYLPAAAETSEAPRVEAESTGMPRGSGRILVMDDEKVVREVARRILTRLGYDVATAGDGAEAVEAYRRAKDEGKPYVAVVMDLTVPGGMGGREAAKLLKELDPSAKVIVSSGYSTDPVMSHYKEYGFDGVAAKPYRFPELAGELARVLSSPN
ncbi:MAG: PAS domain-containing hybrid sensor histidine kinase/response regulator [Anaerolineae bacterium]